MYRVLTQIEYQNKHYNINQKDEGTQDDRGRDGGINFILRTKEQETRLTLHKHDEDDDLFQTKSPVGTLSLRTHFVLRSFFKAHCQRRPRKFAQICVRCQILVTVYPRDKDIKCNLGTYMKGVVIRVGIFVNSYSTVSKSPCFEHYASFRY